MRSSNRLALFAGALALGGCSSGWWHDPPTGPGDAAGPAAPADAGGQPLTPADNQIPGDDFNTGNGAGYPPPAEVDRRRRAADQRPAVRPSRNFAIDSGPPPPAMPPARYDQVGYAVWSNEAGAIAAAHRSLPPGAFAEVTVLDTGATIVVPITAAAQSGAEIELSGAAAQELGLGGAGQTGVRVRAVNPTGADLAALRAGRPAPARPVTPPVLLNALRHKLEGTQGQPAGTPGRGQRPLQSMPARPAPLRASPYRPAPPVAAQTTRPPARPATARPVTGKPAGPEYYVQIAALSDAARAQALARSVGGTVQSGGGLYRVRLGPFDDPRTAQAARDDVARRGYGDARIVRQD